MHTISQKGFAAVEAVLVVIVIALLGGVGYYVVANKPDANQQSAASQPTKQTEQSTGTPTSNINSSLEKDAALETATVDESTADIDKSVEAAVDSAASIGDSYNENQL